MDVLAESLQPVPEPGAAALRHCLLCRHGAVLYESTVLMGQTMFAGLMRECMRSLFSTDLILLNEIIIHLLIK